MFLAGIVPGPQEPPLTCLNHYLTPLVNNLVEFWERGVYLSRTSEYRHGGLMRCAIVCLVCDLPAAHKTAGFGAFSHTHFCSICHCTRQEEGYGDINVGSWRQHTNNECCAHATLYINSLNAKLRQAQFDSTGLRWSELLRLPYFDIVQFVVVDAMHNLFLGLVKEHFKILGIRIDKQEKTPSIFEVNLSEDMPTFKPKEQKSLETIVQWLSSPMNKSLATEDRYGLWKDRLLRCHVPVLKYVCEQLGAQILPSAAAKKTKWHKKDWTTALLHWRASQTEAIPHAPMSPGHVFTQDKMHQVQNDIHHMVTPSWLTSVPVNLGSAAHEKLKADQWRVLGATYLPLSLVRLWGKTNIGDDSDENATKRRKMLDISLSLLSAIAIASSRVTSSAKADLYLQHMQSYLSGLKQLFPHYAFCPNHHMALHLHKYLLLYGPVHSWWAFSFERLIGMLQRTNQRSE